MNKLYKEKIKYIEIKLPKFVNIELLMFYSSELTIPWKSINNYLKKKIKNSFILLFESIKSDVFYF